MHKERHKEESYECTILPSQMVGTSEAARNLSYQISRANKGEDIFILKNNAVKAVLLGYNEYERLCHLAELAETAEIAEIIAKRKNADRSKDMELGDFLKAHGL